MTDDLWKGHHFPPDEPHRSTIVRRRIYAVWCPDLRAALDGRYGPGKWDMPPGEKPPAEFRAFVEEHARDWLAMAERAGGSRQGG